MCFPIILKHERQYLLTDLGGDVGAAVGGADGGPPLALPRRGGVVGGGQADLACRHNTHLVTLSTALSCPTCSEEEQCNHCNSPAGCQLDRKLN